MEVKTSKATEVWPVSYVEQSPVKKVSPLTTMEMGGVKTSLPLKIQARQSPVFKHIDFYGVFFVQKIMIFS